jgi:hypothetical protein
MNIIALVLVACLPHGTQCKSMVQHPTPVSHEECNARAAEMQQKLAGTMDDAGYRPLQVICMYGDPKQLEDQ